MEYRYDKNDYSVEYTDSEARKITLYGEVYAPIGEGKFPAVILSHGFNGHYTDFATECKRFAERGYLCYAFDFCGAQANGKSVGRSAAEYTPFTMKEDVRAAIADFKKSERVDNTRIFLFGGSQGGFVTALAAADEDIKNDIAAIAMVFPAFGIPDDWRGKPIENTPLMGYSIGAAYIRSVQELDTYAVIGKYKGDVCIVWGDRDEIVKRAYIDRAVESYGKDRTELTVLKGAGHGYDGAALESAIKAVLEFFQARSIYKKQGVLK